MDKFIIYFGKDPEELENGYWSNGFDLNEKNIIEKETIGKFETNDIDMFWREFLLIRENPPTMWYWVFINKQLYLSGAIDPDDYEVLIETFETPKWVYDELKILIGGYKIRRRFSKGVYARIKLKDESKSIGNHYFADSGSVYDFLIDYFDHYKSANAESWTELAFVGDFYENDDFEIEMVEEL